MSLPLHLRIAAILRQHVGRDHLIGSAEIARELGLRGSSASREIRKIISECRNDGTFEELELPIVSIPGAGYFMPANIEECEAYDSLLAKLKAAAIELHASFRRTCKAQGIHLQKKL